MRGIAALAILLFHCGLVAGVELLPAAFLSVDVFFVLSGFVLGHSYEPRLRADLSIYDFLRFRARR